MGRKMERLERLQVAHAARWSGHQLKQPEMEGRPDLEGAGTRVVFGYCWVKTPKFHQPQVLSPRPQTRVVFIFWGSRLGVKVLKVLRPNRI